MELLIAGVALGVVITWAMFTQKVWKLQDELHEARFKAKFYKDEYLKAAKDRAEWDEVNKCTQQDLFTRF